MKKQRKAQLVLVSIGLLLILLTYIYPYFLNKNKLAKNQSVIKRTEETTHDDLGTSFVDLEYRGQNLEKPFTIKMEKSIFKRNILMEN